jgi:hypothetical protein
MLRRDYILRTIEELVEAFARIKELKHGRLWMEAATSMDELFNRLVGFGSAEVARLSETELLARLIQSDPTSVVHEKTLMLAALLKEAGDVAFEQNQIEHGRACYLKGLHLLLGALAQSDPFELPDLVPSIESFTAALGDSPLPQRTLAGLMQHYERSAQYGKAEDVLYALLEGDPGNQAIFHFGDAFYRRLEGLNDEALAAGDLPRSELEAGAREWRQRAA